MNRLGKLPPKLDDRTLLFQKYVVDLPCPAVVNWQRKVSAWPMLKNDEIADCTCAAAGHMIHCWTANASRPALVSDTDVLYAYETVSGYNPSTGENDNGAAELDVLKLWRNNGIGNHKIVAFTSIDRENLKHIKQAIYTFGGCYIGLALPKTAMNQSVWSVPWKGIKGDGERRSWGGHAVPIIGYDMQGLYVVTWGTIKRMTWRFWEAYGDEAYGIVSSDWLKNNRSPSGFDMASLLDDLKIVTKP